MQSKLEKITELMRKIERQPKPTGLKLHWNGTQWDWTMTLVDPKAEEWEPKNLRREGD
jgi:hypothetical protein